MGGVRAAFEVELEAYLGHMDRKWDERMAAYQRSRRTIGRNLTPNSPAMVPASVTRPLLLDLGNPGGGLLWKTQQIAVWGDNPMTTPLSATSNADQSSGVVANATATATMPAVAGKTNVLNGLEVTGLGATAGSTVTGTITGVQGGTQEFTVAIPAGVTTPVNFDLAFPGGLAATGPNVAIVVSVPAFGAGNTNAEVNTQGVLLTGGPVQAAVFVGGISLPSDLASLPSGMDCVAPNLSVPTQGALTLRTIVTGPEHLYVLVTGIGLTSYQAIYASADVLEAHDNDLTLSWL